MKTNLQTYAAAFLIVITTASQLLYGQGRTDDQEVLAMQIAERAMAAEDQLQNLVCDFELLFGTIESREKGMLGELSKIQQKSIGLWAKQNDVERFCIAAVGSVKGDNIRDDRGNLLINRELFSEHWLANRDFAFSLSNMQSIGRIVSREKGSQFRAYSALNPLEGLGISSGDGRPGHTLYDLISRDHTLEECTLDRDGVATVKFTSGEGRYILRFDEKKNYLPLSQKISRASDPQSPYFGSEIVYGDYVVTENGLRVPKLAVLMVHFDGTPAKSAKMFRIKSIEARPPTEEELTVKILEPIQVVKEFDGNEMGLTISPNFNLTPTSLGDVAAALDKGLAKSPASSIPLDAN